MISKPRLESSSLLMELFDRQESLREKAQTSRFE